MLGSAQIILGATVEIGRGAEPLGTWMLTEHEKKQSEERGASGSHQTDKNTARRRTSRWPGCCASICKPTAASNQRKEAVL